MAAEDPFAAPRAEMLREQLQARGVNDPRVLEAMAHIPRQEFVPVTLHDEAYSDRALPIDDHQTISQPYIVGLMSQVLELTGKERVLEIGTGSGYQTAILCLLAREVFTIEQSRHLAEQAAARLHGMGMRNVRLFVGDGGFGLPDFAPYEAILCAAAAPTVPEPLRQQLSPAGGRLILPIGGAKRQYLFMVNRNEDRFQSRRISAVRFVPLVGHFGVTPESGDAG
ncbi:MAG: protein-L-isoaspartate(D-aspartate) O-methyltransferase [Chloroflexi bacterium]|nr:protein-L-isoaspartate(D-aspartate) O-methyltransferase [Chloroflexota bacterium]